MTQVIDLDMEELREMYVRMMPRERDREKDRRDSRERYYTLKSYGICVVCGQEYAVPGHTRCAACRLYENQKRSGYTGKAPKRLCKETR